MKKVYTLLFGVGLLFAGFCVLVGVQTQEPPSPKVQAGGKNIPTLQGSYCWEGLFSAKCVDKFYTSPFKMGKGSKTIEVNADSKIKIDFHKTPSKLYLEKWMTKEHYNVIKINNHEIPVPNESGVYVYHMSANWEKGSASYAFSIKVK